MRFEKAKTIGYWVTTGLVSLDFLYGGITQIMRPAIVVETIEAHLGYPAYFTLFLGVWKALGGLALLLPRFPRLKEWAYAGIFFDLTAAAFSLGARGDGFAAMLVPLVFLGLAMTSWALRPATRTLRSAPAPEGTRVTLQGSLEAA
jgi:uncharacterized membrane protein YphA (DoxX/SURF4 family)